MEVRLWITIAAGLPCTPLRSSLDIALPPCVVFALTSEVSEQGEVVHIVRCDAVCVGSLDLLETLQERKDSEQEDGIRAQR
jgi:hypothetical protein